MRGATGRSLDRLIENAAGVGSKRVKEISPLWSKRVPIAEIGCIELRQLRRMRSNQVKVTKRLLLRHLSLYPAAVCRGDRTGPFFCTTFGRPCKEARALT